MISPVAREISPVHVEEASQDATGISPVRLAPHVNTLDARDGLEQCN